MRAPPKLSTSSDSRAFTRPLLPPVTLSALNVFSTSHDLIGLSELSKKGGLASEVDYRRYGNESERRTEQVLADLEGAKSAVLCPSGMAAISLLFSTLAQRLEPGSEIIFGDELYRQTRAVAERTLAKQGITLSVCPANVGAEIKKQITSNTKVIFLECPSNPYLQVPDLQAIAKVAKAHNIITVVDSTLASSINLQPLKHGIDIVIQSGTKYLGGHHDLISGAIFGSHKLMNEARAIRGSDGSITTPEVAAQLERYLTTLQLRVRQQNKTALKIAQHLQDWDVIERVWYPGLESHPDYETAQRLMSGFGGVITFTIKGDQRDTSYFLDQLKNIPNGPSFGGPEALIEQPRLISYYQRTDEEAAALGITGNLVRFSVGLADAKDLLQDLWQAAKALHQRQTFWRGFEKGIEYHPSKAECIVLDACYVSPTNAYASVAMSDLTMAFSHSGTRALALHTGAKNLLRTEAARLLETDPKNISIIPNCATGISQLTGFRFKEGDEVIGYEMDYPSNLDPWKKLEERGVVYKQIKGEYQKGCPTSWCLKKLEAAITSKTRIVALDHVKYIDGFAVDLQALGELCKRKNVFLVIDAAQSAGALPLYPEACNIAAIVASGWKWLGGPLGSAILYTSEQFRQRINPLMLGPDATTRQRYSESKFELHQDGRKFEPGTVSSILAAGLGTAIKEGINPYGPQKIFAELLRLQDFIIGQLDNTKWNPLVFPTHNRSGILAVQPLISIDGLIDHLQQHGVNATEREGKLRIAPPYYATEEELQRAVTLLNAWTPINSKPTSRPKKKATPRVVKS